MRTENVREAGAVAAKQRVEDAFVFAEGERPPLGPGRPRRDCARIAGQLRRARAAMRKENDEALGGENLGRLAQRRAENLQRCAKIPVENVRTGRNLANRKSDPEMIGIER